LRSQILVMLSSVALVAATLNWWLVSAAVRLAERDPSANVSEAVSLSLGIVAVCTVIASLGAAAYLHGTIRREVRGMHLATDAIAAGDFRHRIGSTRRDDLGALAEGIDAMSGRLQQLEVSRQRFIASVSHELRTPLTVARGHAFTLARNEHDASRKARIHLVEEEIVRVAEIVDDLLTASTLQVRPLTLDRRPAEILVVAATAVERFRDRAERRDIGLRIVGSDSGARVMADVSRLQQLIGNLLDNAIRHADASTVVTLSIRKARHGSVRVVVRNSGATICKDRLSSLFRPFVQGDERAGVAGLGLSIASDLARAHGSELKVQSDHGVTEFYFDLPLVEPRLIREPALVPRFAT
jgi:histidine kinase